MYIFPILLDRFGPDTTRLLAYESLEVWAGEPGLRLGPGYTVLLDYNHTGSVIVNRDPTALNVNNQAICSFADDFKPFPWHKTQILQMMAHVRVTINALDAIITIIDNFN
jgi:hypothetical protein